MKNLILILALTFGFSTLAQKGDKAAIENVLNNWHKAAASAEFDSYFSMMTPDAIFIGTDPAENWNLEQFKEFSRPYFENGKAWDFKPVERNVYVSGDIAWFDELLDTWMKLCRGSGVMKKVNGQWKIAHYVLSMTVPNDNANDVVKIIAPLEDKHLEKIKAEKK